MTIDFGRVENYIGNRGFGFVSLTFAAITSNQVFFHIKVVRRTDPELAKALDSTTMIEQVYFWYEYRTSPKGREVVAILNPQQVCQHYCDQKDAFVATIKAQWLNLEKPLLESLRKAAVDLLTANEVNELAETRESLEVAQKRRQDELLRAEATRLRELQEARVAQQKAEAARIKAVLDQNKDQQRADEEEFRQLVAEISMLGFKKSSELSRYIVRNRLGHKYKNISGILQMELAGNVWDFDGGFPPKIYARLCEAIGLGNEGSQAVPTKFTPYKDVFKR